MTDIRTNNGHLKIFFYNAKNNRYSSIWLKKEISEIIKGEILFHFLLLVF